MPQRTQIALKNQRMMFPKHLNTNRLKESVTNLFGTCFAVTNSEETARK